MTRAVGIDRTFLYRHHDLLAGFTPLKRADVGRIDNW
jgi:hypothetical protein